MLKFHLWYPLVLPVSLHESCYVYSFSPTYLSGFSIMAPTPIKWISHFTTVKGGLMNFSTFVTENEWGDYYQLPSYKTKSFKELKATTTTKSLVLQDNQSFFVCLFFVLVDVFFKANIRSCYKTISIADITTLTSRTERWCDFFSCLAL